MGDTVVAATAADEKKRGKRKKTTTATPGKQQYPTSSYVGTTYVIGKTNFMDKRGLYITKMGDYEILSTEDFSDFVKYAPMSLRQAIVGRWRYSIHISYGMSPSITRDLLYARVVGGQILAYKYLECSIEGNESVYYGFIPSIENYSLQDSTHSTCRFVMQSIFPRLLYVHLSRSTPCSCSANCWYWKVTLHEALIEHTFCGKNIPWSRIYVIMGELDTNCTESVDTKESRECPVCAQCFECSIRPRYCRIHRICKHKQAITKSNTLKVTELAEFVPKPCKRLRNQ